MFHPHESLPYAVVASFSNVTERKRAEEQVHLLQTLALTIGQSPDFNSALEQVLRLVCDTTGWNYGEVWIPDTDSDALKLSSAYYINPDQEPQQLSQLNEFRSLSEAFNFPLNIGIPGRVWASQQPEWQKDVSQNLENHFLRQSIALQTGIKTSLGIPVSVEGQVLAVLVFFKLETVDEDQQIIANLAAIAAQFGSVLQHEQIEAALRESESRFKAFMNHSPAVAFMKDEVGRYVYANESLEQLL